MYISTRGEMNTINSSQAMINGISSDNGLYVPNIIPKINLPFSKLIKFNYKELVSYILKLYLDDFSQEDLDYCIMSAYDSKFDTDEITPLISFNNINFLELYHGQTLAFKDIALSLFPHLLNKALINSSIGKKILILTATSGDTGKAALEGFKDIENIHVMVFYPTDGVSLIQKLQMITQEGNNLNVIGIDGNFDECQTAIKTIFSDNKIKNALYQNNFLLSSANSINIGRLFPQIIYYFKSYLSLVKKNVIAYNEKINFTVPSGNFGDILAGYYAKEMGLPIKKLICASNENNVLSDFFKTGIYDTNRAFKITSSPSMDILISSNLERLLYHISKGDTKLINNLFNSLKTTGMFKIPSYLKANLSMFYGDYSTEEETYLSIKKVFDEYNYLIDPHTAVAHAVYEKYRYSTLDTTKNIILSTASPYKFPEAISKALDVTNNLKSNLELIENISKKTGVLVPIQISELFNKEIRHKENCKVSEIENMIYKLLGDDN